MSDETPDGPLSHIGRPNPPWRDERMTECGKYEADVAKVISCDEAIALGKKYGKQRASFLICMTCWSTASRHSHYPGGNTQAVPQDWRRDPAAVMARYLERASRWRQTDEGDAIRNELRALGMLVEAHRDEFDAALAGMSEAGDLTARRIARGRRQR